jgi:hypothetical protein
MGGVHPLAAVGGGDLSVNSSFQTDI